MPVLGEAGTDTVSCGFHGVGRAGVQGRWKVGGVMLGAAARFGGNDGWADTAAAGKR